MKVYRTDEIRNVVLLGHGGGGKRSHGLCIRSDESYGEDHGPQYDQRFR